MKSNTFLTLLIFICFFQISCEKDNLNWGNNFYIRFSNGSLITEKDIQFYDTSSHLLFLKQEINLDQSVKGFDAIVDAETIYHGVVFPAYLSTLPPEPIYILDQSNFGNDIVQINCHVDSLDFRNDPRIINALARSNLLRCGLSCTIDNIEVSSYCDYSSVNCTITVKNNDKINYYILDPVKMGVLDFNYYTGGLFFTNAETRASSFLRWSVSNPDYANLTLADFSILKGGQQVKYTFQCSDYYKMEKGTYTGAFRFCGYQCGTDELELNQHNGRIWVGQLYSTMEKVIVE